MSTPYYIERRENVDKFAPYHLLTGCKRYLYAKMIDLHNQSLRTSDVTATDWC